ncbi:hypothetical protein Syun_004014 [Stephania yunnanensis]|uniref:Peptidase A1 domain-containing protein n=1 Tax=Stephania yunnanensis TaxID=152371 RepID=A0AAP0L3R1_9MAGN
MGKDLDTVTREGGETLARGLAVMATRGLDVAGAALSKDVDELGMLLMGSASSIEGMLGLASFVEGMMGLASFVERLLGVASFIEGLLDVASFIEDFVALGVGCVLEAFTCGGFDLGILPLCDDASVDNIAIGCGHNAEGLFVGATGVYKGITTSQLDELAVETAVAMTANQPDYASINVLVWRRELWSPIFIRTPLFYYVSWRGSGSGDRCFRWYEVAAGGDRGGVIMDSGMAVTRLETAVYEAVRDMFLGGARGCRRREGGAVRHVLRFEWAGEREHADVGIAFRWGKSVRFPARNYLVLKVQAIIKSIILK